MGLHKAWHHSQQLSTMYTSKCCWNPYCQGKNSPWEFQWTPRAWHLNPAETPAPTKKWGHGIGSCWEHGFHLELNQTMTKGVIKTTFLTLCCMHWIFLFILLIVILVIVVLLLNVLLLSFFDWSNSFPATVGGGKKMAKILYHTVLLLYNTLCSDELKKTWWCEDSFKQITL